MTTARHARRMSGFSLIEMAVVLFIVVLLLGSLLVPFATQVEQRRIAETQKTLEEVKEALIGFAVVNGRLPCPDQMTAGAGSNDGLEDSPGVGCTAYVGNLPWATLGVGASDAWGNRLRYQVAPVFANPGTPFSLSSAGALRVCATAACATITANGIPAVVLSHGKNGYGAVSANTPAGGGPSSAAPTSADELQNTHAPTSATFVSRVLTPASPPATCGGPGQPLCEFDDLVTWLSPNILFNRMVAAQRLP